MNAWAILIAMALASFAVLLRLGKLPRIGWEPLAAALVLGCAGYALQGRPNLSGSPALPSPGKSKAAEALIDMRASMDKNFSAAQQYLIPSDAYSRDGDYKFGAGFIRTGLKLHPKNADLWAGLGVQLMLANDGKISPPAQLAFDRARALSNAHPAPDYFTGLDALFAGKPDQALILWRKLLVNPPKNARWPAKLESQVKGLEQMVVAANEASREK